jgi:hypothetical protein
MIEVSSTCGVTLCGVTLSAGKSAANEAGDKIAPNGGYFLQVGSDGGRGVREGISTNAMHHISAAMIAGYHHSIGMTDLLCQYNSEQRFRVPAHHGSGPSRFRPITAA